MEKYRPIELQSRLNTLLSNRGNDLLLLFVFKPLQRSIKAFSFNKVAFLSIFLAQVISIHIQ